MLEFILGTLGGAIIGYIITEEYYRKRIEYLKNSQDEKMEGEIAD